MRLFIASKGNNILSNEFKTKTKVNNVTCCTMQLFCKYLLNDVWPISIKVTSKKNDAWSMFHSPRCIIVASLVNYVPATSLETQKANASNASMLCQQNVKTMYFKTLNPRLFNLRQWFEVRFFSVVICKCCKFSTSLLGSCTWEFWMELKKIKFKVFVEQQ